MSDPAYPPELMSVLGQLARLTTSPPGGGSKAARADSPASHTHPGDCAVVQAAGPADASDAAPHASADVESGRRPHPMPASAAVRGELSLSDRALAAAHKQQRSAALLLSPSPGLQAAAEEAWCPSAGRLEFIRLELARWMVGLPAAEPWCDTAASEGQSGRQHAAKCNPSAAPAAGARCNTAGPATGQLLSDCWKRALASDASTHLWRWWLREQDCYDAGERPCCGAVVGDWARCRCQLVPVVCEGDPLLKARASHRCLPRRGERKRRCTMARASRATGGGPGAVHVS